MKKIIMLLGMLGLLIMPAPTLAHAEYLRQIAAELPPVVQEYGEHIETFDSHITINPDGTLTVEEQILYDFGSLQRHGIFRYIPYIKTNQQNEKFKLDIKVLSVAMDEQSENYDLSDDGDNLSIKIGEANKTITGQHLYELTYTVAGGLTYFSDHDELYWNSTGNGWTVPIGRASTHIDFAQKATQPTYQPVCYTGAVGSTESTCKIIEDGNNTVFVTTSGLSSGQGLTIIYGLQKGAVAVLEPQKVIPFSQTVLGQILGLCFLIASFIWYFAYPLWLVIQWFLYGRDPKSGVGVVRAWFDPPKLKTGRALTPGETGTLVDETADFRDISASIVNLAQRGYLKIIEDKEDEFQFQSGKSYVNNKELLPFERTLLGGIFNEKDEVEVKKLKLYETIESTKKQLYEQVVKDGLFPKSPQSVRVFYTAITVLAFVTLNIPLAIVSILFGMHMARKTTAGAEAAAYAHSLKNFLSSQERQLNFQGKEQFMFEKLLPYAVAFGVESNWAKRFADLKLPPPDWYQGYNAGTFNSALLMAHLNSSFSSVQAASAAPSSSSGFSSGFSSGGGFSGGGGGGGGGGSW